MQCKHNHMREKYTIFSQKMCFFSLVLKNEIRSGLIISVWFVIDVYFT